MLMYLRNLEFSDAMTESRVVSQVNVDIWRCFMCQIAVSSVDFTMSVCDDVAWPCMLRIFRIIIIYVLAR